MDSGEPALRLPHGRLSLRGFGESEVVPFPADNHDKTTFPSVIPAPAMRAAGAFGGTCTISAFHSKCDSAARGSLTLREERGASDGRRGAGGRRADPGRGS